MVAGKSHALHDRVDQLCTRAIKWANLKRLAKAEKKLAITVFSFPPDKGNVGTAAYLNVFSSIYSVLKELKADGYNVEGLPESSEALIEEVIHDKEARFSSPDLNIAYKMPTREYYQLTPYAKALEESWGKAPGTLNSDGQNLLVYGKQFGNVFIGVQPTFGYEGDPMRLLFSKSASPHHGFAAYYTFLEKIFKADAVLHFGTHGSLEFMPGKQVGIVSHLFVKMMLLGVTGMIRVVCLEPRGVDTSAWSKVMLREGMGIACTRHKGLALLRSAWFLWRRWA